MNIQAHLVFLFWDCVRFSCTIRWRKQCYIPLITNVWSELSFSNNIDTTLFNYSSVCTFSIDWFPLSIDVNGVIELCSDGRPERSHRYNAICRSINQGTDYVRYSLCRLFVQSQFAITREVLADSSGCPNKQNTDVIHWIIAVYRPTLCTILITKSSSPRSIVTVKISFDRLTVLTCQFVHGKK